MTIDRARQKVLNYIENSTRCCYGERKPNCPVHTEKWIETEVAKRVRAAKDAEHFDREWTSKLGAIVPKMSGRKIGEKLLEIGLRVYDDQSQSYYASQAALDEGYARIINHYGYPTLYWSIERTLPAITEPSEADQVRWSQVNKARENYQSELTRLDSIIDHDAYLSESEQYEIISMYKSGCGNPSTVYRKAKRRAFADAKGGIPLKLHRVRNAQYAEANWEGQLASEE